MKKNYKSTLDKEKYIFYIEHFGKLEMKGENVYKALEILKKELSPDIRFKISKAFVIKNNNFWL